MSFAQALSSWFLDAQSPHRQVVSRFEKSGKPKKQICFAVKKLIFQLMLKQTPLKSEESCAERSFTTLKILEGLFEIFWSVHVMYSWSFQTNLCISEGPNCLALLEGSPRWFWMAMMSSECHAAGPGCSGNAWHNLAMTLWHTLNYIDIVTYI